MSRLFDRWEDFNQDLSEWDVSNVTNMSDMFLHFFSFQTPIFTLKNIIYLSMILFKN
jgi:surface protein